MIPFSRLYGACARGLFWDTIHQMRSGSTIRRAPSPHAGGSGPAHRRSETTLRCELAASEARARPDRRAQVRDVEALMPLLVLHSMPRPARRSAAGQLRPIILVAFARSPVAPPLF